MADRDVIVAAETEIAVRDTRGQFTAEAMTLKLGCRVDEVELEHLAARGALEPVAKYVYQARDMSFWRTWIAAKLDQREREREPAPPRVAERDLDPTQVERLAALIEEQLAAVPEDDRERLVRAALERWRSGPEPAPAPIEEEPAPIVRTR